MHDGKLRTVGEYMAKGPTIGDVHPFNLAEAQVAADFSARRFEYLIARRDGLLDRIRFGSITLNGASIVALFAAVGGDGQVAKWIGLTAETAKISAAMFVLGAAISGLSIILDARLFRQEAGDAEVRRSAASLLRSSFYNEATQANDELTRRLMADYQATPLVDFQYSSVALWAQSLSTGLWLGGVLTPLTKVVW